MKKTILSFLLILAFLIVTHAQENPPVEITPDLEVIKLSDKAYIHRSYAVFEPFGRVASNGLVYVSGKEGLVFDTPPTDQLSEALIGWIRKTWPGINIKGVVINHFHADCLGGLKAFHALGIPSYAGDMTRVLAEKDGVEIPKYGFAKRKTLKLSGEKVVLFYPGEAHTRDNSVGWMPDERVLFGGCMVKAVGAGKGNVADANEAAWPGTVAKVRKKFKNAEWVIPGHGQAGGVELLDFTVQLFSRKLFNATFD